MTLITHWLEASLHQLMSLKINDGNLKMFLCNNTAQHFNNNSGWRYKNIKLYGFALLFNVIAMFLQLLYTVIYVVTRRICYKLSA